jgi:hypothetical protein
MTIYPESQERMSIYMSMIKREEDKASNHLGAIIGNLSCKPAMEGELTSRIMYRSSCYYRFDRPYYRSGQKEESEEVANGDGESMI